MSEDVGMRDQCKDPYILWNQRRARKAKGLTVKELARQCNTDPQNIWCYERVRFAPSALMRKQIAVALEQEEDALFPENLSEIVSHANKERKGKDEPLIESDVARLFNERRDHCDPVKEAVKTELQEFLQEGLQNAGLTYREREVLRLRFGLFGERPHTLEEVGPYLRIGRERVRQVEVNGLTKLTLYFGRPGYYKAFDLLN